MLYDILYSKMASQFLLQDPFSMDNRWMKFGDVSGMCIKWSAVCGILIV